MSTQSLRHCMPMKQKPQPEPDIYIKMHILELKMSPNSLARICLGKIIQEINAPKLGSISTNMLIHQRDEM